MSIDGPRFAAFLAFTERGFTPEAASSCVMALHPLDDAPVPGRQFEKAVRARSRMFAKDARRAPAPYAVRLAHDALSEYRTLALQFGERYYETRYDQYLPTYPGPSSAAEPQPRTSAPAAAPVVATPPPGNAWWDGPSESPPPPPPTDEAPPHIAEGVNASWGYAAPERTRPAPPPSAKAPLMPPIPAQGASAAGLASGAAPARTFGEAVAVCLRRYAVFSGRASRSEYWYFALFTFLVSFAFGFIAVALPLGGLSDVFGTLVQLALFIPGIAVGVRRMHDVDRSGWFVLVPVYNIVLLASKGTDGPNRFG